MKIRKYLLFLILGAVFQTKKRLLEQKEFGKHKIHQIGKIIR
jgi:hypothetical protein